MSNASTVSKLVTMVKGIFGRKDKAEPVARAAAPAEKPAAPEQPAEPTAAETAEAEAAGRTTAEKAAPSEEEARAEAEQGKEETPEKAPESSESESAQEPEQSSTPEKLVEPEEREAVAEELSTNEDDTQVASDEVLQKVRKESAPTAEDLPVPGYDELTLPSIRARLRKLTIDEVRLLRAYEVAHQERPEFVKMYDNRITKLQNAE